MEKVSIKTPDDFIALTGHSPGFLPHESLVCVMIDDRRIDSTLRIDLPRPGTNTDHLVDHIARYVRTDRQATGVVFGIFSSLPWAQGQTRPHEEVMESLTGKLSERGVMVRD